MSLKPNNTVDQAFSFRLALLYTLFLAISFAVLFTTTYQLVNHIIQTRDREVIQAKTEQFNILFQEGGVTAISDYFSQQIRHDETIFVRIIDRNNQVRFLTVSHPLWQLLDQKITQENRAVTQKSHWDELAREEAEGSWMVSTRPLDRNYFLQVGRSNTESRLVLTHFRRIALRILVPALLISLLGGWLAAHSALKPLRSLIETIRHILETGDQTHRVPDHAQRGELGTLSTQFNELLDRNEMLIQRSAESLDNVAHDLRTPMTHLRNSAEQALQMYPPDMHTQQEALADCMEESENILKMLNALMDLAEADIGGMNLQLERVSLRELADETIELYAIVAEERKIELRNEVPTYLTVEADRLRLRQCLTNLIDNALKYSEENRKVVLSGGREEGGNIQLSVSDQGCGISAEDLNQIWSRLYRCERSRATPGLGLGLSMVQAIAKAHGGDVKVESQSGQGSSFSLLLPDCPSC